MGDGQSLRLLAESQWGWTLPRSTDSCPTPPGPAVLGSISKSSRGTIVSQLIREWWWLACGFMRVFLGHFCFQSVPSIDIDIRNDLRRDKLKLLLTDYWRICAQRLFFLFHSFIHPVGCCYARLILLSSCFFFLQSFSILSRCFFVVY